MGGNANLKTFLVAFFAFAAGGVVCAFLLTFLPRGVSAPPASVERDASHNDHAEPSHEETPAEHAAENVVHLSAEGERTIGVRTEVVHLRPLAQSLTVPGVVEAAVERVAKITPPVAGKIVRVLARRGDMVTKGQPLLVMDSPEVAQAHADEEKAAADIQQAQAALQTARAETKQARTRRDNAQTALTMQRELANAGAFAQPSLLAAKTALADAEAELATAQEEARLHEVQLERARRLFEKGFIAESALDASRLERSQDEAKALRATARAAAARETFAREERLAKGGLLNRQAKLSAEADVRTAETDIAHAIRQEQAAQTSLAGARQALTAATANLRALEGRGGHAEETGGGVTIFSPISGVVSAQSATLGETVERSATLFQIEDLSAVIAEANVPEKDIAKVKAGLPVTVSVMAYPGERFTDVVQSLASSVAEKTRALAVRCLVENPSRRLKPEMFASVSFPVGATRPAVAVLTRAIVTERGEGGAETPVVFVASREEREYEKRKIMTGRAFGDWTEIADGLKVGEKVVVAGAYALLSEIGKGALGEEGHAH